MAITSRDIPSFPSSRISSEARRQGIHDSGGCGDDRCGKHRAIDPERHQLYRRARMGSLSAPLLNTIDEQIDRQDGKSIRVTELGDLICSYSPVRYVSARRSTSFLRLWTSIVLRVQNRKMSKQEYWFSLMCEQEQSGLTITGFCASQGIKPCTFHYWRRRYRQAQSQPRGFVELLTSAN